MGKEQRLSKYYGMDDYGFANLPRKVSGTTISRQLHGEEMGCAWCFPHGDETVNSRYKNKRNWKYHRDHQYREDGDFDMRDQIYPKLEICRDCENRKECYHWGEWAKKMADPIIREDLKELRDETVNTSYGHDRFSPEHCPFHFLYLERQEWFKARENRKPRSQTTEEDVIEMVTLKFSSFHSLCQGIVDAVPYYPEMEIGEIAKQFLAAEKALKKFMNKKNVELRRK